jgi:curved DNA-binding protein CbpA
MRIAAAPQSGVSFAILPMSKGPMEPAAVGSLGKTPMAHLLVYALERKLTGTFELWSGTRVEAALFVSQGLPANIGFREPGHSLGTVLVELGLITHAQMNQALGQTKDAPHHFATTLLELGAIDLQRLDVGHKALVDRNVERLFRLPNTVTFAYYDTVNLLEATGSPSIPTDPFPALWRGVRSAAPDEHLAATLKRMGSALLRAAPNAQPERFCFSVDELGVLDVLKERPASLGELSILLGPERGPRLAYLLMITKQVDLVDPMAAQAAIAALAAAAPTAVHAATSIPPATRRPDSSLRPPTSAAPSKAPSSTSAGPASLVPQPTTPSEPVLTPEQAALKKKILDRAAQITTQDYFQMLGLERDASPEAAQRAYISLAKEWHPDRLTPALASAKDACSKVFSCLSEAHATLKDPKKREEYIKKLKEGTATPNEQAKVQAILEAATEFQKADVLLKRSLSDPRGLEMLKHAIELDPDQVLYRAMLVWVEAQAPEFQARGRALEKIKALDELIYQSPNCERALFYRAMLHKRTGDEKSAIRDFKQVAELNPKNLDATREVRLYAMRGGNSKPTPTGAAAQKAVKPAAGESISGLFNRLFKK